MTRRMVKELRYRYTTIPVAGLIFAVCLSCVGFDQQGLQRVRADRQKNSQLTIVVTASQSLVKLPPNVPELPLDCEPTKKEVRLYANTTSPHKDEMKFAWQVPVGRLRAKTSEMVWDLSGVEAGTYTATVEATDRHKQTASGSITVTVVICPGWLPDPPPCPTVSVICPSRAKGSVVFEAAVAGGDSEIKRTYKWSLSKGKIITGQKTAKITVDLSGLGDEFVTGTVSIGGFNPLCNKVASCTLQVGDVKLQ